MLACPTNTALGRRLFHAMRHCVSGIVGLGMSGLASASLIGDTVHISSFANPAGINVVVGAGIEFDFTRNGQRDVIDIDAMGFTVTIYAPSSSWFYGGAASDDKVVLTGLDLGAGRVISDVELLTPATTGQVTAFNLQFIDGAADDDGMISFEMTGGAQRVNPISWTFAIRTVPEPGTLALLGIASLGLLVRRHCKA